MSRTTEKKKTNHAISAACLGLMLLGGPAAAAAPSSGRAAGPAVHGSAAGRAVHRAAVAAPAGGSPAKKPPVQRLIFGDEEVQAGQHHGEGTVVQGTRRPKHSSLITIRQNFIPELVKSADGI